MSDHTDISPSRTAPSPLGPARPGFFGRILEKNRTPERRRAWRILLYAVLALLLVLNVFFPNHHPHFGIDRFAGFWPAFSFFMGVGMIFLVKKIVQPLIKRPEDYYGDL
jgi:peptidoglycan/LPS O-acetylase OafA/YrhL